jgi:DNA-binding NarL/FixJ family response regulator
VVRRYYVAGMDRVRQELRRPAVWLIPLAVLAVQLGGSVRPRQRVVADGEALLSPSVTRRLVSEFAARTKQPSEPYPKLAELTSREREVMALVAEGLTNSEIGERLFMSPATARTHVSRILTKLGARDRTQLVVMAYESGLVRPGWQD